MGVYILKLTAILTIFWLIYVLLLEREQMHKFKRFYLLTSVIAATIIPLLSITQFVYVKPLEGNFMPLSELPFEFETISYWTLENILFLIYSAGAFIFLVRFISNLRNLYRTIKQNETLKQNAFTYVLLQKAVNPHTFFNYIFFNKTRFETKALPEAVILHEETHAKQKHSLDVLFMELIQIVFWFHPLLFLYKRHIKLNHEFLADAAVLNKGIDTKNYQNILLAFSSQTQDYQLANAINYSSIKKRFTVMKTKTSKTRIWLSSLLVLPLLGILFYSFSSKEIVEIQEEARTEIIQKNQDFPTKKQVTAYNTWSKKLKKKHKTLPESEKTEGFPVILNNEEFRNYNSIYDRMSAKQLETAESFPEAVLKMPPPQAKNQKKATVKQITEYNVWAKTIRAKIRTAKESKSVAYPIIKLKDIEKFKYIYSIMTEAQKKNAEAFPKLPPPPPPKHKGKVSKKMVNTYNNWIRRLKNSDGTHNIITNDDYKYYISIYNNMTDAQQKTTKLPPPPPPPKAPKTKQIKEEREIPAPPPPPIPENASPEEIVEMKKVTEAYAKKHPKSSTKTKINGKLVEIVEIPIDQEGATEIHGNKYKYIIKDGETTYYNSKNKKYTEEAFKKHILELERKLKKNQKTKD
jgi:hypothetical protein